MNVGTIIGLTVAFVFILGSVAVEGGHLSALVNVPAAMIVFGGTFGATIVTARIQDVLNLPRALLQAFLSDVADPVEVSQRLVDMARLARREGFLGLEKEIAEVRSANPFMAKALQLVADGTPPETVTGLLETELAQIADRHATGAQLMMTMGGLAPTLGVTGTVMGLVHMMSRIDDPSSMGPAIASAFLATLYGVASANVIFIPLGDKLKTVSRAEQHVCRIVIEGVRAIQRGDSPIVVAEALRSFLPPSGRGKLEAAGGAAAEAEVEAGERAA
ncbi:MAG: motility protein A [Armatimonadota bacterium]